MIYYFDHFNRGPSYKFSTDVTDTNLRTANRKLLAPLLNTKLFVTTSDKRCRTRPARASSLELKFHELFSEVCWKYLFLCCQYYVINIAMQNQRNPDESTPGKKNEDIVSFMYLLYFFYSRRDNCYYR